MEVGGGEVGSELAGERGSVGRGRLHDELAAAVGEHVLAGRRVELAEVLVGEDPADLVAAALCDASPSATGSRAKS